MSHLFKSEIQDLLVELVDSVDEGHGRMSASTS